MNRIAHAWPGNVRELQNVIERAVLLAKGEDIETSDLPFSDNEKEFQGRAPDHDNTAMLLDKIQRQVIKNPFDSLKLLRVLILNHMDREMKGAAQRRAFVDRIRKIEQETRELISHYLVRSSNEVIALPAH
jgi:DNA-binding NtrC family response regulator